MPSLRGRAASDNDWSLQSTLSPQSAYFPGPFQISHVPSPFLEPEHAFWPISIIFSSPFVFRLAQIFGPFLQQKVLAQPISFSALTTCIVA